MTFIKGLAREVITRLTQVIALWAEDVERDGDREPLRIVVDPRFPTGQILMLADCDDDEDHLDLKLVR
jgi:hypothetical protein